jgi:hypothetical protein
MQKGKANYRIISGILIATVLSIGMMTTGITKVLAQTNPMNPSLSQGTAGDGSMANMNMSSAGGESEGHMHMASAGAAGNQSTVSRDSIALLLQGQTIPAKGFLHVYDSTPYMINAGHVALHIPCDTNSKPVVDVLIGPAPAFKVVEPEIIKELSQPGQMCLYHADIDSDPGKKVYQTDVALLNNSTQPVTFPPSSTVVIGVNEIQPGVPGG